MRVQINRRTESKETDFLKVFIGLETYRITESVDGKLCINKISEGDSDLINIHPRSGNEIELS